MDGIAGHRISDPDIAEVLKEVAKGIDNGARGGPTIGDRVVALPLQETAIEISAKPDHHSFAQPFGRAGGQGLPQAIDEFLIATRLRPQANDAVSRHLGLMLCAPGLGGRFSGTGRRNSIADASARRWMGSSRVSIRNVGSAFGTCRTLVVTRHRGRPSDLHCRRSRIDRVCPRGECQVNSLGVFGSCRQHRTRVCDWSSP